MATRIAVRTATRQTYWPHSWDGLRVRLASMSYADAGKRDLRLDFLRGLAVAAMVVDHVGGDTPITRLTGGNHFIVSAAEAFVFLSGVVLGMVYGDRIRLSGAGTAARKMWARAFTLYKSSLGVAATFLALMLFTDARLWGVDRGGADAAWNLPRVAEGLLTLRFSFHGSDVLVMYTLMLAIAPAIVIMMHRGHTISVLATSAALWTLYQVNPAMASFPWGVEGSSFPFAAWQLLLTIGLVVGYNKTRVIGWLQSGDMLSKSAVLLSGSAIYLLGWSYDRFGSEPLPVAWSDNATYADLFTKYGLGPGRVVAFLSIAVLTFTLVNALWVPLKAGLGWLMLPLGQASLYVYITHLFVLVLIYNLAPLAEWANPEMVNTFAQVGGLGLIYLMVRNRFLFSLIPR